MTYRTLRLFKGLLQLQSKGYLYTVKINPWLVISSFVGSLNVNESHWLFRITNIKHLNGPAYLIKSCLLLAMQSSQWDSFMLNDPRRDKSQVNGTYLIKLLTVCYVKQSVGPFHVQ